ncbi:MAG: hypothetical protein ACTSRG_18855 [Candidatus Helarchaeota archaeon]
MSFEKQIKIRRDWINPLLTLCFAILSIVILFLLEIFDTEVLNKLFRFYPIILIFPKILSHTTLFLNIALPLQLIGAAFFLWFGLGTQKCNLGTFGFGFGVPSSGTILACSSINFFYFSHGLSYLIAILSLISLIIGSALFLFRHNVDRIIIYQIIPFNNKITELDLKKLKCPDGMLRLQRAISRGIRAQYLNPLFYLDKEKLIKSNVKIIDKKYLYKNVHASHMFGILGYSLCFISVPFLIFYFFDGCLLIILFFLIFVTGLILTDYYYIHRLNLRKTILIIDHWLRRTGEVDLSKIDKKYGFLPIKYSISKLKRIAQKYESFLSCKIENEKQLKKLN